MASRHAAARVVGWAYLTAMATSMVSEMALRGPLMVEGDALATAARLVAHRERFRLAIACDLATLVADLALITALVVILAPSSRPLAWFAAGVRLIAEAVAGAGIADSFGVLRILNGSEPYRAFTEAEKAALAWFQLGSHSATLGVGFVLLGIGSAVFARLWLRSGYVPRAFGWLGVAGSALLAAGSFATLLVPGLGATLGFTHMLPLFAFEVGMGLWLAAGRIRLPRDETA